jgi:hypothetical protein
MVALKDFLKIGHPDQDACEFPWPCTLALALRVLFFIIF